MAARIPNDIILEQLKTGTARFELVTSSQCSPHTNTNTNTSTSRFFARIRPSLDAAPPSKVKKVEQYTVQKVTGDGRCMFRALVKGMARNKGLTLTPRQERDDADEIRTAVKEVICDSDEERLQYQEAVIAITVDEPLRRYCQRIGRSNFWGGESELLVLSKLCHQTIIVYIPESEHKTVSRGSGFIPIAEYGGEYCKASWKREARKVVRLLYSGGNHYDLLI